MNKTLSRIAYTVILFFGTLLFMKLQYEIAKEEMKIVTYGIYERYE